MERIKRGDIVVLDFSPSIGSEQSDIRPAIVLQNNLGNKYSPTTIIAPLTSKKFSREFLTNVFIAKENSGLSKDSTILFNQITTIDKSRIKKKISSLDLHSMMKVDLAIKVSLGLN